MLFFSPEQAAKLAKELGYTYGCARRAFERMLRAALQPLPDPNNRQSSNFFAENLTVIANRLDLDTLEIAAAKPGFDKAVLNLDWVGNKTLKSVHAVVAELRPWLEAKP